MINFYDELMVLVEGRHPSLSGIAVYFNYHHLPDGLLRQTSERICETALSMAERLDGPELVVGLRKLLEAKDCFVRAALGVG